MNFHWARVVGVTLSASLVLHFLLFSGTLADWIGAEGFYAHFSIIAWLFLLYPITIVGASLIVAFWVKEKRASHFFVALFVALLINSVCLKLVTMHGERESKKAIEQMYMNDPQKRPLLDSQRPLSIIKVSFIADDQSSAVDVLVHAMPGVLESGESAVEVRGDVYMPDANVWGEGKLYTTDELTQGGRVIYTGTVSFIPEEDWYSAAVIVRGLNGEFTTSSIQNR